MKFSLIRPAAALVLALGLAACGGGDDDNNYSIKGTVEGLVYPGLVLTTNGKDLGVAPPAKAGDPVQFTFPHRLGYGDEFSISVKTQPAHQSCGVNTQAPRSVFGTGGELAQINALFVCEVNAYSIGGKITGLTKDTTGLVLTNGSSGGSITPVTDQASGAVIEYAMPFNVPFGVSYGVTVVTQPVGRFCTVSNPTGIMGDAPVTNIDVNCVPT
ncbi:hypothetical protein [Massilia sp. H6]|uniref:hypothetical protein n=1 Tax=Massilia sp. H6 TaxID=2970464 RepID=UPI002169FA1E|nr:hypothetical protein [Massilia sp. H6]UVW28458.1 hypothetical protein NRS07_18410 [Massilia sp. H6]